MSEIAYRFVVRKHPHVYRNVEIEVQALTGGEYVPVGSIMLFDTEVGNFEFALMAGQYEVVDERGDA